MADRTNGGLTMNASDIIKYGAIILVVGGGIARYEMRQNLMDQRLAAIETVLEDRANLLKRAVAVLEKYEEDRSRAGAFGGVSSGASSRRGR